MRLFNTPLALLTLVVVLGTSPRLSAQGPPGSRPTTCNIVSIDPINPQPNLPNNKTVTVKVSYDAGKEDMQVDNRAVFVDVTIQTLEVITLPNGKKRTILTDYKSDTIVLGVGAVSGTVISKEFDLEKQDAQGKNLSYRVTAALRYVVAATGVTNTSNGPTRDYTP
jgi:hypothetical protein